MARNQTMFYATALDLSSVLSVLEAAKPIQYTTTGLFETKVPQTYSSFTGIPDFGRAIHPTAVANPSYLLSMQGTQIRTREIPQKAGGVLFAVDQAENPDSVVFRPGGRYGNAVILYGTIGTVSQSSESKDLYNFCMKAFRKGFLRQQEFLVGPEAREVWNAGVRLTIGASSPVEFDLKRESAR
jgi:hypothetical protein